MDINKMVLYLVGGLKGRDKMMNFEVARFNMVESQVRPNGITDSRIIAAMAEVPREVFVPAEKQDICYMDDDITVANSADGQRRVLIEPMALARLLQLARITSDDYVLDIGGATGYSAAVIAHMAQSVVAIDEDEALVELASENFANLSITNAVSVTGIHRDGLAGQGPFDVIFINGRVPVLPEHLADQLKNDGRLVVVIGDETTARAIIGVKSSQGFSWREDFAAPVSPLPGFEAAETKFVF